MSGTSDIIIYASISDSYAGNQIRDRQGPTLGSEFSIPRVSGFSYPNISDQDKQSHEAGYLVKLTWGFTCAFTSKGCDWQHLTNLNRVFQGSCDFSSTDCDPYECHLRQRHYQMIKNLQRSLKYNSKVQGQRKHAAESQRDKINILIPVQFIAECTLSAAVYFCHSCTLEL